MRPWFQLREAWGGWQAATPHIVDWPQAGQTAGKALCGADVDRPVFYPLHTAAAYRVKACARCYELLERHRRDHIQPVQRRRSR